MTIYTMPTPPTITRIDHWDTAALRLAGCIEVDITSPMTPFAQEFAWTKNGQRLEMYQGMYIVPEDQAPEAYFKAGPSLGGQTVTFAITNNRISDYQLEGKWSNPRHYDTWIGNGLDWLQSRASNLIEVDGFAVAVCPDQQPMTADEYHANVKSAARRNHEVEMEAENVANADWQVVAHKPGYKNNIRRTTINGATVWEVPGAETFAGRIMRYYADQPDAFAPTDDAGDDYF